MYVFLKDIQCMILVILVWEILEYWIGDMNTWLDNSLITAYLPWTESLSYYQFSNCFLPPHWGIYLAVLHHQPPTADWCCGNNSLIIYQHLSYPINFRTNYNCTVGHQADITITPVQLLMVNFISGKLFLLQM